MAVPKNKTSQSKKGMRRSHDAISSSASVECPKCGERKLPHHVCPSCGSYDKKDIVK
ncbi:MAG: 50S ribosomal protein L32 [Alphaproteobacteria bacterium]|nr:50S ribosomal protein L32 [Alphaproteobacteria bacterium]